MNVGVKVWCYSFLFFVTCIILIDIYKLNTKICSKNINKEVKLNWSRFLSLKLNKDNNILDYHKIVVFQVLTYLLIFFIIVGCIISIFIKNSIVVLFIYGVLMIAIMALAISLNIFSKRRK